jgi:putative nucleotidyltransferase with HDIG domain
MGWRVTPDPLQAARALAPDDWLVGGAVRDRLLGRETADFDLATVQEPRVLARELGHRLRAYSFELSEGFGGWRVVARDHAWQVDVLPLLGGHIETDLAQRDLTINAMAQRLDDLTLADPFSGRDDLAARRLRMVSDGAFAADPLRVLRAARLACELDFEVEPGTALAARAHADGLRTVSPERVFGELRRILASPRAPWGLELLGELGITDVVLPELAALRGVAQSPYHHLDVYEHTRAVLQSTLEVQDDLEAFFPGHGARLRALQTEPLTGEVTRGEALRFGALLHDIAKPQTRSVSDEGRTTFMGHDVQGAEVAVAILSRLRASQRLSDYVAALTRHHLRLGFLVHRAPLGRREVYRYLAACEPVGVDVTILSVADRLATRGRNAQPAIERHLALARATMGDALAWQDDRPRPPVRGDEVARVVGGAPGPWLGRVLRELEEAAYAGEISGPQEALELARELAEGHPVGDR